MEARSSRRPQQVLYYRVGGEMWGMELEERRRGDGLQANYLAGVSVCIQGMLSGVADWDETLSWGEKYKRWIFEPTGGGGKAGGEAAAGGQVEI